MQSWLSTKVTIKNSTIAGKGAFAIAPIEVGEPVVRWNDEYIDAVSADRATLAGKVVMQWDNDLFSVESRGDDQGYFINHSCDPNLWMLGIDTLVARRKINPGEELLADYALWEADENFVPPWKCRCGSAICRHLVTGKDWRDEELQEKYKGHFSPLINKRISSQE